MAGAVLLTVLVHHAAQIRHGGLDTGVHFLTKGAHLYFSALLGSLHRAHYTCILLFPVAFLQMFLVSYDFVGCSDGTRLLDFLGKKEVE